MSDASNVIEINATHGLQHELELLEQYKPLYESTTPKPERVVARRDAKSVLISAAFTAILVGGLIVSGSRTVPEFALNATELVGISAFVMIELFIIVGRYVYVLNTPTAREKAMSFVNIGVSIAVILAMTASLHYVLKGAGVTVENAVGAGVIFLQAIEIIISILIAIVPVMIIFIVADVLAILVTNAGDAQSELDNQYQENLKLWESGLLRSWASKKHKYLTSLPAPRAPRPAHSTGTARTSKATEAVQAYLRANPDAIGMSVRELTERMNNEGVKAGRSTIAPVLAEFKQLQESED